MSAAALIPSSPSASCSPNTYSTRHRRRPLDTFVVILIGFVAVLIAGSAFGQHPRRCESTTGRRVQCRFDGAGTVELSRQLGTSACIKGQPWGVVRNTIWVDRGCRADFNVVPIDDRNGGGWRRRGNRNIIVVCESKDGRRHRCASGALGQITLGRQLSSNRCIEGRTWGASSNGVWVDGGCRGEFLIGDNAGASTKPGAPTATASGPATAAPRGSH